MISTLTLPCHCQTALLCVGEEVFLKTKQNSTQTLGEMQTDMLITHISTKSQQ